MNRVMMERVDGPNENKVVALRYFKSRRYAEEEYKRNCVKAHTLGNNTEYEWIVSWNEDRPQRGGWCKLASYVGRNED